MKPDFLARELLTSVALRTLLDDYIEAPGQFDLLRASSRHLSTKIRVFVDFTTERLFASTCTLPAGTRA